VDARDGTLAARAVQPQDGLGGVVPNPACVRWLP
jgi:hypothetical protein